MRKIKYQGGITKYITAKVGAKNKARFTTFIADKNNLQSIVDQFGAVKSVDMDAASFSSSRDFEEQVLSILSFVRNVGAPVRWTIYSDGSHTAEQADRLRQVLPFVHIVKHNLDDAAALKANFKQVALPWFNEILEYAREQPMGKKLLFYINHRIQRTTVFTDSDVLFYPKAEVLISQLDDNKNGYFLPDSGWGALDSRYRQKTAPQMYQVNAGFFIAKKEFDFVQVGMGLMDLYDHTYEYFSEQTIFHVLLNVNGYTPLDPRVFILDSGDQFDFSNLYHKSEMAVRHFTGPVRHKMWQQDWKWQLSIS